MTNTAVEIDTEEVSSFLNTLKSLSLKNVIWIVILVVVLLVFIRLLTRLLDKLLTRSKVDPTLYGFLRTGIRVVLYFLAAIIVAGSLNVDVSSLIALLSVAGLALSLAIQGALSNLAGGIVILTTKPLHVGDYVAIGDSEGYVEEIGMTYTRLKTYDHRMIFIPNSNVTAANIVNYTQDGKRRVELTVSASYDAEIETVKAALRRAVEQVGGFYADPPVFAQVAEYGESAISYTVRAWCGCQEYWDQYYALLEAIKTAFDQAGIAMTYPHLNVHLEQ